MSPLSLSVLFLLSWRANVIEVVAGIVVSITMTITIITITNVITPSATH
jgi:hypothetical protein